MKSKDQFIPYSEIKFLKGEPDPPAPGVDWDAHVDHEGKLILTCVVPTADGKVDDKMEIISSGDWEKFEVF